MNKKVKEAWKEKVTRFCTKIVNLIITVFLEEVEKEEK